MWLAAYATDGPEDEPDPSVNSYEVLEEDDAGEPWDADRDYPEGGDDDEE
jgi:hypothetical protein